MVSNAVLEAPTRFRTCTDVRVSQFAFPWLLTTLHTTSASLGCYILLLRGHFKMSKLTTRENLVLISFSFLFTVNIAISNVSLSVLSAIQPAKQH